MQHKKGNNIKEDNLLSIKSYLNMNSLQPAQNYLSNADHINEVSLADGSQESLMAAGGGASSVQENSIVFWSTSLAGTSSIRKSFWQGAEINTNGILHCYISRLS